MVDPQRASEEASEATEASEASPTMHWPLAVIDFLQCSAQRLPPPTRTLPLTIPKSTTARVTFRQRRRHLFLQNQNDDPPVSFFSLLLFLPLFLYYRFCHSQIFSSPRSSLPLLFQQKPQPWPPHVCSLHCTRAAVWVERLTNMCFLPFLQRRSVPPLPTCSASSTPSCLPA